MTHATEEDCLTRVQIVTSTSIISCVFFFQLAKAEAGLNGRRKSKLALEKFDKVTCRVSKPHEQH